MAGLWLTLVLLSLAVTPNAGTLPTNNHSTEQIFSAVKSGIELYNKEQGSEWAFALHMISRIHGNAPSDAEIVHFFIKETDCLKSQNKMIEECAFKDEGKVEHCSMVISGKGHSDPVCDSYTKMVSWGPFTVARASGQGGH
ncbi:hypothetical protein XENTR_v10015791 [Xenopus tropicalis]|nr:hypothetical protein XENTR_v10015791 [Xenopus tropicalis]